MWNKRAFLIVENNYQSIKQKELNNFFKELFINLAPRQTFVIKFYIQDDSNLFTVFNIVNSIYQIVLFDIALWIKQYSLFWIFDIEGNLSFIKHYGNEKRYKCSQKKVLSLIIFEKWLDNYSIYIKDS